MENNLEKPCWLQPDKLVKVIDEYMSNVGHSSNVNQLPVGQNAETRFNAGTRFSVPNVGHNEAKSVSNQAAVKPGNPVDNNGEAKRCHRCNSAFHLIAQCPQDRPTGQRRTQSGQSGQRRQSVNACSTTDFSVGSRDHSLTQASGGQPLLAATATSATQPAATDGSIAYVNKVTVQDNLDLSRPLYTWNESGKSQSCCESVCDMPEGADFTDGLFDDLDSSDGRFSGCSHERKPIEVGLLRFDIHRFVADCQAAMHYVDLHIADASGNRLTVNSLFDSGTQISVLKASAVESLSYTLLGKVTLQTFDKRVSVGDLVSFDVKIDGARSYCPIRFVVCANVSHDCLLSLADYRGLLAVADKFGAKERQGESTFGVANVDNDPGVSPEFARDSVVGCGDDAGNDGDIAVGELAGFNDLVDPNSSQVGELIAKQSHDKSLTGAFALARDNKGGYFLRNSLLFHLAQI